MKRFSSVVLLSMILFSCATPSADRSGPSAELSLVTGYETGTYYRMGKDMKALVVNHDIDLNVIPSTGSVENLLKVYRFRNVQLGMTQYDTLTFMIISHTADTGEASEDLGRVLATTQLVLPLYREEIHLVAKEEIKRLADLTGKRIAVGEQGSGTFGTALVLMESLEIKPASLSELGTEAAIEALRKGEIDAFFAVVGAPADALARHVKTEDQFRLVPIEQKDIKSSADLKNLYQTAAIPANTYPWQKEAVQTLSVLNMLITSDREQGPEDCAKVGKFARTVYSNLPWLRQNGHPKWKSVEIPLESLLRDNLLSPCVQEAFKK